jgi:sugar lactone lactonase YvrE
MTKRFRPEPVLLAVLALLGPSNSATAETQARLTFRTALIDGEPVLLPHPEALVARPRPHTVTLRPRTELVPLTDRHADLILGKPAFSQVGPNQVVNNRVFNPAGVVVDRSVRPNRVYVYDSGNNRVLGMSHLGFCSNAGSGTVPCTSDSDTYTVAGTSIPCGTCVLRPGLGADLVLGQPTFATSGCNGDSAFQAYPSRAPASASTLCSVPESTISIVESYQIGNMAVDSAGNLYVPDVANNRVLRYNSPFTTDRVADYVWGQTDFTGKACNRGRSSPDDHSLCFIATGTPGAGVAIDGSGNLWVADSANNRVLRFSYNPITKVPDSHATLVLGQPSYTTATPGAAMNQLAVPIAVRVNSSGTVYVLDSQWFVPCGPNILNCGRVLSFAPAFSNGMSATTDLTSGQHLFVPTGLELDASENLWVTDFGDQQILLYNASTLGIDKLLLRKAPPQFTPACGVDPSDSPDLTWGNGFTHYTSATFCDPQGSVGIDADGNVLVAGEGYQDVWHFAAPPPASTTLAHGANANLFRQFQLGDRNQVGRAGLNSPTGVTVYNGLSGSQLIVADRSRLLFWNNAPNFSDGQGADGVVGQPDFLTQNYDGPQYFGRIKTGGGYLWAIRGLTNSQILVYSLPLASLANPIASLTISSPLPVVGGGHLSWDSLIVGGLAPDSDGTHLWVADPDQNRVFRIRNPGSTFRVVDVILGQPDASGTLCNRTPGVIASNTLCHASAVSLDPAGNVWVADSAPPEQQGNLRLLEFDANPSWDGPGLTAGPAATRAFGTGGSQAFTVAGCQVDDLCSPFDPAFSSAGQMVVGMSTLQGSDTTKPTPFPLVYNSPLARNSAVGALRDYQSLAISMAFDERDNLYVIDHDRSRVLIYLRSRS